MRYSVIKLQNGLYGVKDVNDKVPVAVGFAEYFQAAKWCDRLNLRAVWGR